MIPQISPPTRAVKKKATPTHQNRSMKPLAPGSQSGSSNRSLPVYHETMLGSIHRSGFLL